ncbi:DUF305 domain-containing protein [Deinococcus sp. AJ005]|uniref:DUF305 domain-containing protein n=1 Tax=Deinococcus sp. AJ005 TaxID=2652443 RepID=UPI00125CD220|nr:DUF305 domain-containing protein [Deinococcus sp. AJ005]QFP75816.1 DUF305 domain-containing protein [Deinococcus sp. AJ005]
MFGLMHLNTSELDHIYFSQTRMWMALYMGATMAVIMLGFTLKMYRSRRVNMGSIAVFAASLWLLRSQATVGDVAWMKAIILHHSIAILTSERAQIKAPRVRELADGIIKTQSREIGEMKASIADLENKRQLNPAFRSCPVTRRPASSRRSVARLARMRPDAAYRPRPDDSGHPVYPLTGQPCHIIGERPRRVFHVALPFALSALNGYSSSRYGLLTVQPSTLYIHLRPTRMG